MDDWLKMAAADVSPADNFGPNCWISIIVIIKLEDIDVKNDMSCGSGGGSVGKAVTSCTWSLQFESHHRHQWPIFYQLEFRKDENKEKRGRVWPIFWKKEWHVFHGKIKTFSHKLPWNLNSLVNFSCFPWYHQQQTSSARGLCLLEMHAALQNRHGFALDKISEISR